VKFLWTLEAQQDFILLKIALTSKTSVLAVPNFNQIFVLETDAYDLGVCVVLMQEGRQVAYLISKPLINSKNLALSINEKECMAIL
jgi:hypothetical protein